MWNVHDRCRLGVDKLRTNVDTGDHARLSRSVFHNKNGDNLIVTTASRLLITINRFSYISAKP